MKVSKAWLQTYFDTPLPATDELVRIITFGIFEVESVERVGDDDVLDVKVLPDHSSYCLSHRGIAKEISALIKQPLTKDPLHDVLPTYGQSQKLSVTIETPLCMRYMGAVLTDVTVGPSPEWLKKSLETFGQRSINNIVDATNYVMLNVGQPLHAFDFDKLAKKADAAHITVRAAHEGEKITVLSGEVYELNAQDVLIADNVSDTPIAIAGIKGGKQAEIDASTKHIVLEAANFNYVSVRKTSRKLRLSTDASVRFQNEPSPEVVGYAMRDVIALIKEIAGGTLEGVADIYPKPFIAHTVQVTVGDINTLLGTTISEKEIDNIFTRLGFDYKKEGEIYTVTPPFERTDLNIREDLIEEIGRIYGYENITATVPEVPKEKPAINKHFYYTQKVRSILADLGFSEVYTYTLRDKGEVELENPLAKDKAFLRVDLLGGIKQSLELNAHNAPLLGVDIVKIFEIGTVFKKEKEYLSLALGARAVRGKRPLAEKVLQEALEKLETELSITLPAVTTESISEIDFDTAIASLPNPDTYEAFEQKPLARYTPFSPYPFVLRDIAVWVPEAVKKETILDRIIKQAGELLVRTDLFDTFAKEGRVSYAFHLVFQSKEKTLTDGEVNEIMNRIIAAMNEQRWEVR